MALTNPEKALIRWLWGQTNDSCQEDACFEEDGGAGSGNWGHKGRPGKRGGSGKGGGSKYRSEKEGGGYERKTLTDPAEMANKYANTKSAKFSNTGKGSNVFTPKGKAKQAPAPKQESKAVAGLRESIANGNARGAAIRLDRFPAGTTIKYSNGKEEYTLTKEPDQYGMPGNWSGTHNGKFDNATAQDLAYELKRTGGKFDVTEPGQENAGKKQETVQKTPTGAMGVLKTIAGGGDVKTVTNTINDLVANHKGAVLMNGKEAFWVGDNGTIHSSEGYDIDPKDKEQMEWISQGGYFGDINSEGSFDKDATRNLINQAITMGKGPDAFDSLPEGTKLMLGGFLLNKNKDNTWTQVGHQRSKNDDFDGEELSYMLNGMGGYNGGTAAKDIESKGFITMPFGGGLAAPVGVISLNSSKTEVPAPSKSGSETAKKKESQIKAEEKSQKQYSDASKQYNDLLMKSSTAGYGEIPGLYKQMDDIVAKQPVGTVAIDDESGAFEKQADGLWHQIDGNDVEPFTDKEFGDQMPYFHGFNSKNGYEAGEAYRQGKKKAQKQPSGLPPEDDPDYIPDDFFYGKKLDPNTAKMFKDNIQKNQNEIDKYQKEIQRIANNYNKNGDESELDLIDQYNAEIEQRNKNIEAAIYNGTLMAPDYGPTPYQKKHNGASGQYNDLNASIAGSKDIGKIGSPTYEKVSKAANEAAPGTHLNVSGKEYTKASNGLWVSGDDYVESSFVPKLIGKYGQKGASFSDPSPDYDKSKDPGAERFQSKNAKSFTEALKSGSDAQAKKSMETFPDGTKLSYFKNGNIVQLTKSTDPVSGKAVWNNPDGRYKFDQKMSTNSLLKNIRAYSGQQGAGVVEPGTLKYADLTGNNQPTESAFTRTRESGIHTGNRPGIIGYNAGPEIEAKRNNQANIERLIKQIESGKKTDRNGSTELFSYPSRKRR